MDTPDKLYSYFFKALEHYVQVKGHGSIKQISLDVGISGAFLSQILSNNSPKKATPEKQKAIAKACGYDYGDFLTRGRRLINGENPDIPEKDSGINQTETLDAKVGTGMVRNDDEILQHYREELAALREEIKYLRSESKELRDELKRFREQQKPHLEDSPEKKTAV